MQFTEEEIKLAEPVIKAIKKIAERQECLGCFGKGFYKRNANHCRVASTRCKTCNGTGKGKWEWEPEVGEFAMIKPDIPLSHGEIVIILDSLQVAHWQSAGVEFIEVERPFERGSLPSADLIPLLHWERIREIMYSLGYKLYFRNPWEGATVAFAKLKELKCDKDIIEEMHRDEHIPPNHWYHAPSFQSAVMQAVIELEKNLRGEPCLKK